MCLQEKQFNRFIALKSRSESNINRNSFTMEKLTVRTMHDDSLMAPQQPRKAMIKTMAPIAINTIGVDHNPSPGNFQFIKILIFN